MKSSKNFVTVIMAAGQGTRMKSDMAKVLHPIRTLPMIHYVIKLARDLGSQRILAVIGHQKERVKAALKNEHIEFAIQEPQHGTGHAVMQTEDLLKDYDGHVLVLSGDVPLLTRETMEQLIHAHFHQRAVATVLTTRMPDATGYGRVIRQTEGEVIRIVEHKDASEKEKKIKEVNSGIYLFQSRALFQALKKIDSDNAQHEYYLPDVLRVLIKEGKKVLAHSTENYYEISGINTAEQLREAELILNTREKERS